MNSLKHVIAAFVLVTISLSSFAQKKTGGIVVDAASGDPVVGAAVTAGEAWALTDSLGRFEIKAVGGEIMITSLGYKSLKAALYQGMVYRLQVDVLALNEVIVTATENHGLTASSRIGAVKGNGQTNHLPTIFLFMEQPKDIKREQIKALMEKMKQEGKPIDWATIVLC